MMGENLGLLNKQGVLWDASSTGWVWMTGGRQKGDAGRHQTTKAFDAKLEESQFNHEGIQEPLMHLRGFMQIKFEVWEDYAGNCVKGGLGRHGAKNIGGPFSVRYVLCI